MSSNRLDVEKESAMTEKVNITGLSKAVILQAFFNSTRPQGMGFISSLSGPDRLDIEGAEKIVSETLVFDYLFGRPLKLNLTGDSFDPWGFDRDNGGSGSAQKIIDRLRAST
jgi:hypothetical protein